MPASPSKSQWRTLRRYVLAGDREAARHMLQDMVHNYPEDKEAAAELTRLILGEKLHISESPHERQARLISEAQQELLHTLTSHTPQSLACMPTEELQRMQDSLLAAIRTLKSCKAAAPNGTKAYKKALERELARRRKRSRRGLMMGACVVAAALLLLGATAFFLHRQATDLETRLHKALVGANWADIDNLLRTADTGVNRLMNPRLEALITKVKSWQQGVLARSQELHRQMLVYEKLNAIDTLSLEERGRFLRCIRALPAPFAPRLLNRWDKLCRPVHAAIERQRKTYLAEVEQAIATPAFSGDKKADTELLRERARALRRVTDVFNDAQEAFDLDPKLLQTLQQCSMENEVCMEDIAQFARIENLMNSARNLTQYRRAIDEFHPMQYPPAQALALAGKALPSEAAIAADLRAARHQLPAEIHPAITAAIVDKGPSFTPTHPATPEQVHLMEDTFSSQTLRRRLYEVTAPSGKVNYTDAPPGVTDRNTVVFDISELDPEHVLDRTRHQEWENANAVWIRTIDASPLLRATDISRDRFFLDANVPDLLGRITAVQNKLCPALAKAYLYHTLLELIRLHRTPEIMGLRFSPTLQADIESFRKLVARCPLPLSVTAWLQHSAEQREAEKLWEQWFDAHRNRDYALEMSRNLSRILREQPRYLGYVGAEGAAILCDPLPPRTRIRYYSGGKLITGSAGEPLSSPDTLSPILAE